MRDRFRDFVLRTNRNINVDMCMRIRQFMRAFESFVKYARLTKSLYRKKKKMGERKCHVMDIIHNATRINCELKIVFVLRFERK